MKRLFLSNLFLVLTFLPLLAAETGHPVGAPVDPIGVQLREIFLGRTGEALICPGCPESSPFRVDTATGIRLPVTLPYWRVNDLVSSPDGKKIFVSTAFEDGKESLLLVLSAETLSPVSRIEIPGNGLRTVVSEDGYSAFLIVHRPKKGGDSSEGRWELAGVDLGQGTVKLRFPLEAPAADLALSPDGTRLYLAQEDKVQTFRTDPFTASWFYRSPGNNRGMAIHPGRNHLYVLRGSSIAVFDPAERKPLADGEDEGGDDATRVFPVPIRIEQLVFDESGMVVVGAGLELDEMAVVDSQSQRLVGVWPSDGGEIGNLLRRVAEAEASKGPRGKLVVTDSGLKPPFALPPSPAPPESLQPREAEVPGTGPEAGKPSESAPAVPKTTEPSPSEETEESTAAAGEKTTDSKPTQEGKPPLIPISPSQKTAPESVSPPPERVTPTPPATSQPAPAPITLVEVADQVLEGTLTGEVSLVKEVLLYGPNSIFQLLARIPVSQDGTFSLKLPNPGRYRIVPDGGTKVTLVSHPAFRTVNVKSFGYKGLDFHIKGAVFGSAVPSEKIVR